MRGTGAWIIECDDEAKGNTKDYHGYEEILRFYFGLKFH